MLVRVAGFCYAQLSSCCLSTADAAACAHTKCSEREKEEAFLLYSIFYVPGWHYCAALFSVSTSSPMFVSHKFPHSISIEFQCSRADLFSNSTIQFIVLSLTQAGQPTVSCGDMPSSSSSPSLHPTEPRVVVRMFVEGDNERVVNAFLGDYSKRPIPQHSTYNMSFMMIVVVDRFCRIRSQWASGDGGRGSPPWRSSLVAFGAFINNYLALEDTELPLRCHGNATKRGYTLGRRPIKWQS